MKAMRFFSLAAIAALLVSYGSLVAAVAQPQPWAFAHGAFQRVWERTDAPVSEGEVARTWFWGPQPNTPGLLETYTDAPNGTGQRLVQYFDKSRMELNDPNADPNSPFYVTNGLLTVELISGCIQTGNATCGEPRYPADIPMSGDPGDTLAPTYAAFREVSNTSAGDHPAEDRRGQAVTATIDRNGTVGNDPAKATLPLTTVAHYEQITRHNIPEAFWVFLNQSGVIREQGQTTSGPLITPWFYASGLPISEAYWARATIGGQVKDVMIQAYERRVLTYVPTNDPGWQVEMGNIGQHYYNWRYRFQGLPLPGTGTPFNTPVGAGTPTFAPTLPPLGTPSPIITATTTVTLTESPEPTATIPESTVTVTVVPGTVVLPTTPSPTGTGVAGSPTGTGVAGSPTLVTTITPIASPSVITASLTLR